MESNKQGISENNRGSVTGSSYSVSLENLSNELKDPVTAYFNKRCSGSTKSLFKKRSESDSESSVGLFDVENISLFGDEETENFRFSENMITQLNMDTTIKNNKKDELPLKPLENSKSPKNKLETDLDKQRKLAKKTLELVDKNNKEAQLNFFLTPDQSNRKAYSEINERHISLGPSRKSRYKSMFQPNFSPETPKVFSDELSSVNDEDSEIKNDTKLTQNSIITKSVQNVEENNDDILFQNNIEFYSEYLKNFDCLFENSIKINSDEEFESQSKEDVIKRLEEDEKKFKMETSGVMHNSKLSHFSDAQTEDVPIKWSTENFPTETAEDVLLSIEQYFNKRSNRISSLVGSSSDDKSLLNTKSESKKNSIVGDEWSLKTSNMPNTDKRKLRRWVSSCDVQKKYEIPRSARASNDSTRDTVVIQNILAEMESGLSSSEICDKLLNFRKKKSKALKNDEKENKLIPEKDTENNETPKSSRKKETLTETDKRSNKQKDNSDFLVKDIRKLLSPHSVSSPDLHCKENSPKFDLKRNFSTKSENERIQKLKGTNGFDSSTPKLQIQKYQNNKFRTACSKLRLESEDWEPPRINSIHPALIFPKSELFDDNDKTLMVDSSGMIPEITKNNTTINIADALTVEDTLNAGDLTLLTQRIKEMKKESVCIVRPPKSKEPDLLTVVQKLADLPKGSVNCSALTPLLRDQFPELLSSVLEQSLEASLNKTAVPLPGKEQLNFQANPNDWVKFPKHLGLDEKIFSCPEAENAVFISIENVSNHWLLISLNGLKICKTESGTNLRGVKNKDGWDVKDFIRVYMKDTVVSPDSYETLQVYFTPGVATDLDTKLKFSIKNLLTEDTQEKCLRVRTYIINPMDHFNILPNDIINFGLIPGQCHDDRFALLSFDGICKMPISIYIEQEETQAQHFDFMPCVDQNNRKGEWNGNKYDYVFEKGGKQTLELKVAFVPKLNINEEKKLQHLKATLLVKIKSKINSDAILEEIPLKGSVGFGKFVCNAAHNPFVFRVLKGLSQTRLFPVKNVGNLPITLTFKILDEDRKTEVDDGLFVVPKTFYLSQNEESGFEVTFNGNTSHNCTKRFMDIQIQPNGRVHYEIELIGKTSLSDSRPISPLTKASGSTKSTIAASTSSQSGPLKIRSTSSALSWGSVPLDKKSKESIQIKIIAREATHIRFSFLINNQNFQLEKDLGQEVDKMKKLLKPDTPYTLTIVFRPTVLGPHFNSLVMESNDPGAKKMILLNGVGGIPSIHLKNIKRDLSGNNLVQLSNTANDMIYTNKLEVKNEGNGVGFILIKSNSDVLALSHELTVSPDRLVIQPNSKADITITQKLKREDLNYLISGKDVCKLATLSIFLGCEYNRLRSRKLFQNGGIPLSTNMKLLISKFHQEIDLDISNFKDTFAFEKQFLKDTKIMNVAVVFERPSAGDPTIIEGADETAVQFVTIASVDESILFRNPRANVPVQSDKTKTNSDLNSTKLSPDSALVHRKVTKWLQNINLSPTRH